MLPILSAYAPRLSATERHGVERLAEWILGHRSQLAVPPELQPMLVDELDDRPSLVLDDFGEIDFSGDDKFYLQDRARLRACEGDVVVTTTPPSVTFDHYVAEGLGFRRASWLRAEAVAPLAQACWHDRRVRRELVRRIRQEGLRYIHPHLGNRDIWELGVLLGRTSHCGLQVIAPPPGVAYWVNDKTEFAWLVETLLGPEYATRSRVAYNFAALAHRIRQLARSDRYLCLKVPHASGGDGNYLLDTRRFRGRSLAEAYTYLRRFLPLDRWPEGSPLRIEAWEKDVLRSASVQTWIPPVEMGEPILEGIFSQLVEGSSGQFVGCLPLTLPDELEGTVINATFRLALLLQLLRYVGRCSFDFLIVGPSLPAGRVEFLECNGRWGGTSIPMTVVNRLFGDWRKQPFAVVLQRLRRDRTWTFQELLTGLDQDVFHAATGRGWLIPFNPRRLARNEINFIVLGRSREEIARRVKHDLPRRLAGLARQIAHPWG